LLGLGVQIVLLVLGVLLGLYTTALALYLIKGNSQLNCGCGGILEDDMISWKTIIRNGLIFVILIIGVVFHYEYHLSMKTTFHYYTITGLIVLSTKITGDLFRYKKILKSILTTIKVG
jgi:hypothetical protein